MKQGKLKQMLADNISSKSLDKKQLSKLNSLLEYKEQHISPKKLPAWSLMAAAVAAITITLFITYTTLQNNISIENKIALEVATNHIKLKPLEIKTSSLTDLRAYFTELDFSPVASSALSMESLIGGRYCSIQGITAAQLRLQNKDSETVQSLYQTPFNKKIFNSIPDLSKNQQPVTVHAKGIAVEIWTEKGILFALTKED